MTDADTADTAADADRDGPDSPAVPAEDGPDSPAVPAEDGPDSPAVPAEDGVPDDIPAEDGLAEDVPPAVDGPGLLAGLAVSVVVGVGLVLAARGSALDLLVAVVQGLLAPAWVFGLGMPGRWGGIVIAALAAAGSDVAASVWPHSRLGAMLAVFGLAIPVMFVHQLWRGAARVQVAASLSAISLLVLAEVAVAAYLQLRHEFTGTTEGGKVVAAAVGAIAAALVAGYLVDMVAPVPRFDPDVSRGLLAVVVGAAVGAAVGYLLLGKETDFTDGRAVFLGAGLGALAGLLGVASSFVLHSANRPVTAAGRRLRPAVAALLPICVLAPVGFLICLSVRG